MKRLSELFKTIKTNKIALLVVGAAHLMAGAFLIYIIVQSPFRTDTFPGIKSPAELPPKLELVAPLKTLTESALSSIAAGDLKMLAALVNMSEIPPQQAVGITQLTTILKDKGGISSSYPIGTEVMKIPGYSLASRINYLVATNSGPHFFFGIVVGQKNQDLNLLNFEMKEIYFYSGKFDFPTGFNGYLFLILSGVAVLLVAYSVWRCLKSSLPLKYFLGLLCFCHVFNFNLVGGQIYLDYQSLLFFRLPFIIWQPSVIQPVQWSLFFPLGSLLSLGILRWINRRKKSVAT